MYTIDSLEELKRFLCTDKIFHLYGAGFPAANFLRSLESCGIEVSITDILVTDTNNNPNSLRGIPVVRCKKSMLHSEDCVLLTVNECVKDEIVEYLEDCDAELIEPSPFIFYNDVYDSIRPFADRYPRDLSGLNSPDLSENKEKILWSCWWQGEEQAPDIVKACWKSQRKYLPEKTRHIIITNDNYSEYITIPDYVMDKFKGGNNQMAHLADLIRVCLLYKYGGIWLDSTVLVLKAIPPEWWEFPVYTWRFDKTHFCSKTIWTTWFMGGLQGNELFRFVMEAFFYYFKY